MTSTQAARIVFVAAALEGGFVLIHARANGPDKTFRSLWAIGAFTLGLSMLADFVPSVAGPFALLVLIAMAVRSRGALGSLVGGSPTPAVSTTPQGPQ